MLRRWLLFIAIVASSMLCVSLESVSMYPFQEDNQSEKTIKVFEKMIKKVVVHPIRNRFL